MASLLLGWGVNLLMRHHSFNSRLIHSFNSENRSFGLETGQQKINAIADDELHNLILSKVDNR